MKEQLFETLKQSVEILQNKMTKENEPVWLGTLWNVDQSLAKMAEKYLAAEREKQFDLLDKIAIENEKKNKRISDLEHSLRQKHTLEQQDYLDKCAIAAMTICPINVYEEPKFSEWCHDKAKTMLAERERRAKQ